ncbi:hypothetical protein PARPLA_03013 [Rhodobacteraceae bacterium THAF1]|nr:hypothetical protein FIU81_06975 [Palleronia sp. THAF1]VDC29216.1 hypothetical protein PARPLA_03013 [Rhodobacteraceae bacterium THAF1]
MYAVTAKNSNRIEISEVRLLDQFPQLGYFTEKEREEIIAVLVSTTPETVASELERRGYREKSGWSHVQSWAELAAQFIELFQ